MVKFNLILEMNTAIFNLFIQGYLEYLTNAIDLKDIRMGWYAEFTSMYAFLLFFFLKHFT